MKFHAQDEDLLLLAHQALSWSRGMLVQTHLWVCPRCRARLHRFESVSRVMAGAVRDRKQPPWPGPVPTIALPAVAGWLLLLVVTLTLTILIVLGVTHLRPQVPVSSPSHSTGGCRPDLPSDQCR